MFGENLFEEFEQTMEAAIRRRYTDIADTGTDEELTTMHCAIVKSVFLADNETGRLKAEGLRLLYLKEQFGFSCVRTVHFGVINELLREIEEKYRASPLILSDKASLASIIGAEIWSILRGLSATLKP